MNREQIEKAAKNFIEDFCYDHIDYTSINCEEDNYEAARNNTLCEFGADIFSAGADWRINSVWHDASEIPEANKRVLVCFGNLIDECVYYRIRGFKPNVLKNWNMGNFSLDKVLYWCYLDDLLPERKEETE